MKNNIKEARRAAKMTQKELGTRIGVSESAISQYESGNRQPDNTALLMMAEELGVSVGYLLGAETKKAPTEDGEGITREQIKIALFGDDAGDISDEDLDNAVQFARFSARERKSKGDNK
mgnify:CR=1 FL=1